MGKGAIIIWCFIAFLGSQRGFAQDQVPLDTINTSVISIFSNGYEYPKEWQEGKENIQPGGITGWHSTTKRFSVFFYPQHAGKVYLSSKYKSPSGFARLRVRLDSSSDWREIPAAFSLDTSVLLLGSYIITAGSYHHVEIEGLSKSGAFFTEIYSLLVSGPGALDLKYNISEYQSAPSVHLSYPIPVDSPVAWFYSEVYVPKGINAQNAYYETNGFADGYAGIQVISSTERRIIFSIWSNFVTDDPAQIPKDYAVTLIRKGSAVITEEFGDEGSGGHSHLVFPWKNGTKYKLLVGARAAGDHTIFTAYFGKVGINDWRLLAQWDKSKTKGKLLSGLYAFVENFGPNGDDYFKANYGNQWICTAAGNWIELTRCFFTTTASLKKHQRFDYGAGLERNWFYLFSGGFAKMNNIAAHAVLERQPDHRIPNLDFTRLPLK